MMKLVSVNISPLKTLSWQGRAVTTGIDKQPVEAPVMILAHGLEGDKIGDLRVHGGEFKAVYSYASEHYPFWRETLDRPALAYGMFGENLTTEGLEEETVHIGDRFNVGGAVLEAVQPRFPCSTLATRFQDASVVKRMCDAGCFGIYYKVVQQGPVRVGDSITRVFSHPDAIPLREVARLFLRDRRDVEGLEKMLAFDLLAPNLQKMFSEQLQRTR